MVSVPLLNSGICRTVEAAYVALSCCFFFFFPKNSSFIHPAWAFDEKLSGFEQIHLWNEPPSLGLWLLRDFHIKAQVRDAEVAGREMAEEKKKKRRKDEDGEARRWKRHPLRKSCRPCFSLFSLAAQFSRSVGASERLSPSKRWHWKNTHTRNVGRTKTHTYTFLLPLKPSFAWCQPQKTLHGSENWFPPSRPNEHMTCELLPTLGSLFNIISEA